MDQFDFADLTLRSDGLHELEIDDLGTFVQLSAPAGFELTDPASIGLRVRTAIDDPVTGDPFADFLSTGVDLDFT